MASVAALNVRIGGDIKALEKSLRDAERAVRTAGARLSAAGNELSMKLTLPLLAFGAAAIKSAGEIEAMEKAMQATFAGSGRSIQAANEELVALRKAAEAPGLDFEQAVKASLRLQGVGFSAEKARNTIVQLANAISSTGGTAENLNGVTVQFAQMISKGKILTSDLNVIKENMPGLAKIMQETFGTTSAEALREMGVSGQEFVEKITAAMQKLPRVEGGISNAIVNAGTAIKMFLADVGNSLNKTFNVTEKLEAFSKWLDGLGERFRNMGEGTQRVIGAIAVFAVALGPMLKVGQGIILIYGQVVAVFTALQKVLLQSLAGQAIPGAIAAFKALNTATKLTIIGATIGVVLALAAAFMVLQKDTSAAAQSQEDLAEISKQSTEAVSKEKVSTGLLVDVLKSNTTSLEQKKAALDKLNQIAPEYFKGLNAEKVNIDKLNEGYAVYIDNLLRAARAKAAEEKLIKIDQERMELAEKTARMMDRKPDNRFQNVGLGQNSNIAAQAESTRKEILNGYAEEEKALRFREDALKAQIIANTDFATTTKKTSDAISDNTDATKESARVKKGLSDEENTRWEKEIKMLGEIEQAWADQAAAVDAAMSARAAAGPATDTAGPAEQPLALGTQGAGIGISEMIASAQAIQQYTDSLEAARIKSEEFLSQIPDKFAIAADGITMFGNIVASSLEKGAEGWKSFASEAINAIGDLIGALIKLAVANAVASAIKQGSKINPLVGIALAGVAGALAAAVFKKAVNAAVFADGGIVSGPTHALVGEYPGASNNPEVIAPLNKLKGMLRGTGGDVNVSGTFRVQGTDLLLVLEKAQKSRGRVAGY